jgi:transcription initiation factor TFIID subunit 1
LEDDEEVVLMRCPQQPVLTAALLKSERIFENESSSEESEVDTGIEEDGIQTVPTLPHNRRNRIKQRKLVFNVAEPMKVDSNLYETDIAKSRRHIPDANFDLIHQVRWEDGILWNDSKVDEPISGHCASCQFVEVDSESEQSHLSDIDHECLATDQSDARLSGYRDWQRPCLVEPLCQRSSVLEDERKLTMSAKTLQRPQGVRLEIRSFDEQIDVEANSELLKRISNMTLEVKEKNQELERGDWLSSISWGELEPRLQRSKVAFCS